jgi:hypothetical protein
MVFKMLGINPPTKGKVDLKCSSQCCEKYVNSTHNKSLKIVKLSEEKR